MNKSIPYGGFRRFRKYIKYWFSSGTKHSVHSPLVYSFYTEVLEKNRKNGSRKIERRRKRLVSSKLEIDFTDYGKSGTLVRKKVSDIAKRSLKTKQDARVISRLVSFYNARRVLELGTSLGITTAYIAKNKNVEVVTLEGDTNVANLAKEVWNDLKLKNITSLVGEFDSNLSLALEQEYDVVFIDGNHRLEPTIRYFNSIVSRSHPGTILVLDDIHYSKEMEEAWERVKEHELVKTTVDIFTLGFVFLESSKAEQHFVLKY